MDYTIEIGEIGASEYRVYITNSERRDENYDDYEAETLAEAYLWVAKHFHGLGLNELQKRINAL